MGCVVRIDDPGNGIFFHEINELPRFPAILAGFRAQKQYYPTLRIADSQVFLMPSGVSMQIFRTWSASRAGAAFTMLEPIFAPEPGVSLFCRCWVANQTHASHGNR